MAQRPPFSHHVYTYRWNKYKETHQDYEKQRLKDYHSTHREAGRAYMQRYWATHKEAHARASRASDLRDSERRNARQRRYRHRHLIKVKLAEVLRRQHSRAKNVERERVRQSQLAPSALNDFTPEQWIVMQEHYKHRCVYCGKRAKGKLTQDHITPLSKGGLHTLANIVPACRSCNSKKWVKDAPRLIQPMLIISMT